MVDMGLLRYSADPEARALRFILGGIALVVGLIVAGVKSVETSAREKERLSLVATKYSGETASLISKKMFWQGQTAEQLQDSLGPPAAVDRKIMKTKVKEIWKYTHLGANRYALRITLDNGIVTTWSQVG